jgi:glycosyltransferase involved in cell wall biosynthesis
LYKNGALGYLVTDDIIFRKQYKDLFPKENIKISLPALIIRTFLKIHNFGEKMQQLKSYFLGRTAGKLSRRKKMPLMALQEYAYHAYKYSDVRPRIVFQYHPQAMANKLIFEDELRHHPESATLKNEILIYTPKKLEEARIELHETDYFIAASTFTKQTLVENGAGYENVFVAPYGVDTSKYPFVKRDVSAKVNFAFVGSYVERKGIYYLLNAAKRLEDEGYDFCLKLTARSTGDMSIFNQIKLKNITIYNNLSHQELIVFLHTSDVFVFPSLFEGFAFVIVEAMSTGLPVITTPRTVGPDVIADGEEGFIIEPANTDALYEKMKFFILNPDKCVAMGEKASIKAKGLTWENFEKKVMSAVGTIEKETK